MTATTNTNETILQVLRSAPGSTTAELAEASGVGRSTVGKALAALEGEGLVLRAAGGRDGGRRLPDRFEMATSPPAVEEVPAPSEAASARLRSGELRSLVLGDLAGRNEPVSPSAVAKSLQRSGGAVSNALERLVGEGAVQRVNEHPRRYAIASS